VEPDVPDVKPRPPRVVALLGTKIVVLLGLAVGICVPYFSLQRLDLFPRRTPPALSLDGSIPFTPAWLWAYLSIALLVPLAPLLATRRDELARYARGLALVCLPCFAAFLLVPVDGPRPAVLPPHGGYEWLASVDRATNSFPSLHAALAVYSLLFASRVMRRDVSRGAWAALAAAGSLWVLAILYSTLATRQHWAIDLPAGVLLAWFAHARVWRSAQAERDGRSATASVQTPISAAKIDRYWPGVQSK
jgi:membrane-associated phospholipid phosphatase